MGMSNLTDRTGIALQYVSNDERAALLTAHKRAHKWQGRTPRTVIGRVSKARAVDAYWSLVTAILEESRGVRVLNTWEPPRRGYRHVSA